MPPNIWLHLLQIADPSHNVTTQSPSELEADGKALAIASVKRLTEEISVANTAPQALSPEQQALYTALGVLMLREGALSQDAADYSPKGGDERHCDRCAFWQGSNTCLLVKGAIASGGLCRFHLIPSAPEQRIDAHDKTKHLQDWHGLKLGISHDPGDERHGRPMTASYGCVWGTYGQAVDGMAIDVYVVPDSTADTVYRVSQVVPKTGELDEYKYILGAASQSKAAALYKAHMPAQFFGGITKASIDEIRPIRKDAAPTKRVMHHQGLRIGISHEPGDRRFAFGSPMADCYGCLYRSWGKGMDGKALDVYVRKGFQGGDDSPIYRVLQVDPKTKAPDEEKLMVGFPDQAAARIAYETHAGRERLGSIAVVQPQELDPYRADSLWHEDSCRCEACDRRKRQAKRQRVETEDDDESERVLKRDGWIGHLDALDANDSDNAALWLRKSALKESKPVLQQWRAVTLQWIKDQGSLQAASFELKNNPQSLIDRLQQVSSLEQTLYQSMVLGTLAGRELVINEGADDFRLDGWRWDAKRPDWLKQPFNEAVAYFRQKTGIPVDSYQQLTSDYHDWAFSIAHMTQADWLEAARWLLDRAMVEGLSFREFERQWNRLIGRKGWQPSNPRQLWTLFDTNIRGAIGAGRYQQMTDPAMLAQRPIWVWRWRDSPQPREEHQKLHMKGIRADHAFWRGLRVPAGYGCRCGIFAVSLDYAQRHNIQILDNPPDPKIIADPGFRVPFNGESPYGGRDSKAFLEEKLAGYPEAMRGVLMADFRQLNLFAS